jgi:hypothetical protein
VADEDCDAVEHVPIGPVRAAVSNREHALLPEGIHVVDVETLEIDEVLETAEFERVSGVGVREVDTEGDLAAPVHLV